MSITVDLFSVVVGLLLAVELYAVYEYGRRRA